MIWALQRLANLEENKKIKDLHMRFKSSCSYASSIGIPGHPETQLDAPLGSTAWLVYFEVDGLHVAVGADTVEEAAEKAVGVAEREIFELAKQEK